MFCQAGRKKTLPSSVLRILYGVPSADKLRAKAENVAGLCAGQGIGSFCITGYKSGKGGPAKKFQPATFSALCVKGPVRQRSISADLIFLVTFCIKTKSNSPRGN